MNLGPNNVVYFFSCKACSKKYTGSTENFLPRFDNYKSAHRNFIKRNTIKQASFHTHFEDDKHGMSHWEIAVIDQTESVDDLRRRESFWQSKLDTFQPNGLNQHDVALFWHVYLLNLYIAFIFSSLTHYIYCSTLISTILLCILIILLLTPIIIINHNTIITITIFYLFTLKFIYLFIYLFFIYWYVGLFSRKGSFLGELKE